MDMQDTRYRTGDWLEERYEIEQTHRGGMGYVLLAQDHVANIPVAIKTFEKRFLDAKKNRDKFLQEACTWIQLERHRNIVQAYYLKYIDGSPYLFLERITSSTSQYRGSTLKDMIFSRHMTEKLMINLAIQICDGMIHAKDKFPQLVHRDLKCENILIGEDLVPKVSDFGMTVPEEMDENEDWREVYDNDVPLSVLAARMEGTPAFASPEQCMGLPLDTRSDVYSFGCLLYQMVARTPPFALPTVAETINAQMNERPVDPMGHNDGIHAGFSGFIMRCLEKNPDDRFDSFHEARHVLSRMYEECFHEEVPEPTFGESLGVEEYKERGRSFVLLGFDEYAQKEYDKALFLSPGDPDLMYEMAKVLHNKGNAQASLSYIAKLSVSRGKSPEVIALAAKNYALMERWDQVIFSYERAIDLNSNDPENFIGLANAYIQVRDLEEAVRTYERGIRNCPDAIELYRLLARLHKMLDDRERERKVLMRLLKKKPEDIKSIVRISELCVELGDVQQLKRWVRSAVALDAQQPEVMYRLGAILNQLQDHRLAVDAWKRAIQGGYESADFMKEYAELEFQLAHIESAWNLVLRAEELGADVESLKKGIQAKRFRSMFSRP